MFQALVQTAGRLLGGLNRSLVRQHKPAPRPHAPPAPYRPLERLVLTDGVARTLFEGYAAHRDDPERGDEETGWVLLGLREPAEAVVLATLPAGTGRDASAAHVRFNSSGQELGSRIVRRRDRRLNMLGVVHTHPGSLRHPSDGDYRGDIAWVQHLRGGEGVFGIGTADARTDALVARQPRPHVQTLGELCFSWYALRKDDAGYRPLPVELTLGPDLARPLHSIWPTVEAHAERLDRLCRQQNGVRFEVLAGAKYPGLAVDVPLAEPGCAVRVCLREKEVRYYLVRNDELLEADCYEEHVDRGVYLLLAELAQG